MGLGSNGVAIIGDYLHLQDYIAGEPFQKITQQGVKLEQLFRMTGTSRNQYLGWNVLGCKPPYPGSVLTNFRDAASYCDTNHARDILKSWNPGAGKTKTILGLGTDVMMHYTGFSGSAKEKQDLKQLRGYVLESSYGPFIPTYDPTMVMQGQTHYTLTMERDLQRAFEIARYGTNEIQAETAKKKYNIRPTIEDCRSFVSYIANNPNLVIKWDIETEDSNSEEDEREQSVSRNITLIQFSVSRHTAIAFPWKEPFIGLALEILASPNVKVGHNVYDFDMKVVRDKGYVINGKTHDTMWMFKHWRPKLDKCLQSAASWVNFPFPWKHLYGEKFEFYGCADVDATCYLIEELPKRMKTEGTWEGYYNHVFQLWPIMDRAANEIGVPVDKEEKRKLEKQLTIDLEKLDLQLQGDVPDAIKNLTPRRKIVLPSKEVHIEFGYLKTPKEIYKLAEKWNRIVPKLMELKNQGHKLLITSGYEYLKIEGAKLGYVFGKQKVWDKKSQTFSIKKIWAKQKPFKASSQQLKAYINYQNTHIEDQELANMYVIPTVTQKGVTRETTCKDALKELAESTGDDLLLKVLELRSTQKMLSNDLPNWEPNDRGIVCTSFNFNPPQGQLASRNPNVQNCSKHSKLGQRFRRIVVVPKGYVFVEFDYRSFHVATMGYVANDPGYIRASQLDPHSCFASGIIDDPEIPIVDLAKMSDEEIKKICKIIKNKYKDIRQKIAKPVVLGNQLGLGPKRLWLANKKFIKGMSHAKQLQAAMARMYPLVELAKTEIKDQAHRQTYLINEFGRIQHFFAVYVSKFNPGIGTWEKGQGLDADKAIGFRVQSTAFGMITEKILEHEKLGYNKEFNFQNTVHDSLQFMPLEKDLERCIKLVSANMEKPCRILTNAATGPEGLKVAVEASYGYNWANVEVEGIEGWNNPRGMREWKG